MLCILPVLWMDEVMILHSGLSLYGVSCVLKSGESVTATTNASIPTKFCLTIKISKHTSWKSPHFSRLAVGKKFSLAAARKVEASENCLQVKLLQIFQGEIFSHF